MSKIKLITLLIIGALLLVILGYTLSLFLIGESTSAFSVLGVSIILYALLEPVFKKYIK